MRPTVPLVRRLLVVVLAALALFCAQAADAKRPGDLPNSPATPDNLSGQQWSLAQIRAFEAHAITGGSPLVRVAIIDSGIDPGHPEFAGRIDAENSASCITGEPVTDPTGEVWRDRNGHGTHVAGIIAAGDNDFGIVGVAPHVELLIVKVSDPGLPITPEAAACAFAYAAEQDVDVVNASFAVDKGATGAADPLDFFCRSDEADREAIRLVGRAVASALWSGATIVASAGNNGVDMAHPAAGEDCLRMPVQLPGVLGVSSVGRNGERVTSTPPGPSNHGLGAIDLTAPGGDPAQGGVPGGLILSTFPSYIPVPPTAMPNIVDSSPAATYRYNAGTSMAAAHVSGVAALVVSRFGDYRGHRRFLLQPLWVAATLITTAEPKPCPDDEGCQCSAHYNSFFGFGEVDALAAITR